MQPIFSIGYGGRQFDEFLDLIKKYKINYVIDVRSKPYSRYNPDFTRDKLQQLLTNESIYYVYMGDVLGGQPSSQQLYTPEGYVDYKAINREESYQLGIERLHHAIKQNLCLALMCSERNPQECHRSKLIGETLSSQGYTIAHIDGMGELQYQDKNNNFLDQFRSPQLPLFEDMVKDDMETSRKKYKRKIDE
jgi:uncharacterized protein (DUF488 family)